MFRLLVALPLVLTSCSSDIPAEQLLKNYLSISDAGDTDRLPEVLTGQALNSAEKASQLMTSLELSQEGKTVFYKFNQIAENEYSFCLNVSETKLIDPLGVDRTPRQRPTQIPMSMRLSELPSGTKISELDIRRFASC